MRTDAARCGALLAAVLLQAAPLAARAAIEPFTLGVAQTVSAQTNVYRVPDNETASRDLVSSTALSAGLDQPLGRWRLTGSAALRLNRYKNNQALDNDGQGLALRLEGTTVGEIAASLDYARNTNLVDFGASTDASLRVPARETSQQFVATAQLGLVSLLSLNGSLTHRSLGYDNDAYATQENTQDSYSLGFVWRPSGWLSLGAGVRQTQAHFPRGVRTGASTGTGTSTSTSTYSADSFNRDDLDLTGTWFASGASTVQARISQTRQRYDEARRRDVNGVTGSLAWSWRPTGKLSFNTTAARDTGVESTYYRFNGNETGAVGNDSQLSTTLAVDAAYEWTAKVRAVAGTQVTRRQLANSLNAPGGSRQGSDGSDGSDRLFVASLGLRYQALRSLGSGCDLRYERRSADTSLSYAYRATVVSCYLQLSLQ
jgi:Putative beta-barrel porin 2